ncbi:MAG: bifunctional hydroxymethylpyrimidine kinase/phosphomethylpyrimidine kinase [Verrucomicrobia bacterium]|nr:MAG: bifunctional hydroxymethylpyrimidine kinase/phosphomethylpyrimidine kinase [Verrucomicrobiota bacterium]
MARRSSVPVVLTIAGSDSGGGAGLQADLKTFAALGVHGACAVTCLTAQNPAGVWGIHPCPPAFLRRQLEAVWAELPPAAVKTGMLVAAGLIRALAAFLREVGPVPLVVDPVMVATSGAPLLRAGARRVMERELFPLATVLTPNLPEAEALLGRPLRGPEDQAAAARELHRRHGCAVLVKGGHGRNRREAADVLWDGGEATWFRARRVGGVRTHGTGCTFSAALAGFLALGLSVREAAGLAKQVVDAAIRQAVRIGRHHALWPLPPG